MIYRQYRIFLIVIYYLIYRLICVIFIILDVYYDSLDAGNGVCMKQVKVKNLKGNEITALPIVTDSGTVLIHADVVLNSELINRIRNLGIQSLSIKEYPDEIIDPGEYGHIIIGTDDKLAQG